MRPPRSRPRRLALLLAVTVGAIVGCDEPVGSPPVARLAATPRVIPEDDSFETLVTLDATKSGDPIDDPEATRPLAFEWDITNDEVRYEPGSGPLDPMPKVRFLGDRPATIRLTVTDEDGQSATARLQLQLTVRP